jgi:hypothetical protein
MQQFTVPQFIDVESKIIGPITTRQFIIFLASAIILAASYKLFSFTIFIFIAIFVLILAGAFAFLKVNGRPFHFFILNVIQTVRRPRLRVWNNRVLATEKDEAVPLPKREAPPPPKELYKKSRLAELSLIVDTQGKYKGE